jgi:hypothetical protein
MRFGLSAYRADLDLLPSVADRAARCGADLLFTSMHLPEDTPEQARSALHLLGGIARDHGLELVADVSPRTRDLLGGEDAWVLLATEGVHRLRLDDGFTPAQAAQIARVLPLARNASTEPPPTDGPADVLGVHNFYPRRGTGLALATVRASAEAWHAAGLRLGAFVAGDARRRGPLGDGLPTVEEHRDADPAAQAAALVAAGCDDVVVGDPDLSDVALADLARLHATGTVTLRLHPAAGVSGSPAAGPATTGAPAALAALLGDDRSRPDPAAQQLRLALSRRRRAGTPLPTVGGQPRPRGAVTVDLDDAGRYRGEVRVVLTDLPPDPMAAVVATVAAPWLVALDAVGPDRPVHLAPADGVPGAR